VKKREVSWSYCKNLRTISQRKSIAKGEIRDKIMTMSITLSNANGFGGAVIGREILKIQPSSAIEIRIHTGENSEEKLWEAAVNKALKVSRFGRIALLHDRRRTDIVGWMTHKKWNESLYKKSNHRGEEAAIVKAYTCQCLTELAEEGFGGCVEFSRMARRELRTLKNHGIDTVVLAHAILCEQRTLKTLRHIAGNQLQVISLTDCIPEEIIKTAKSAQQEITVQGAEDDWSRKRIQKLLKQKMCLDQFIR